MLNLSPYVKASGLKENGRKGVSGKCVRCGTHLGRSLLDQDGTVSGGGGGGGIPVTRV